MSIFEIILYAEKEKVVYNKIEIKFSIFEIIVYRVTNKG